MYNTFTLFKCNKVGKFNISEKIMFSENFAEAIEELKAIKDNAIGSIKNHFEIRDKFGYLIYYSN